MLDIVETKNKIEINEVCELSQDSFYTRNPEDINIPGAIGPNSPESIFVKSIEIIKYEDKEDGDVWYHAKVEHDGIWEIYTDTAVGPFIDLKLQENGFNFTHVDFSEQGMQQNGLADLDLVA
tara:strand:- start:612 stop:977 length:366 start_codon:yes stop_codon:yes gene_type:complete